MSWNRSRFNYFIDVSASIIILLLCLTAVSCDRGTNIGCFRKAASSNNMHLNIRADSVDICISNCEKLFYR